MQNIKAAIAGARDAVCAVLRVHRSKGPRVKKGKALPPEYQLSVAGTAFGIVPNRYVVTAFHVFNNGQERDPHDRFYVLTVPANGPTAYHFPVVAFPLEDRTSDVAVLEVGPGPSQPAQFAALPLTTAPLQDGTHVLTYGFPAPVIAGANVSPAGDFLGGQFFLKAHANEGIIAAQYDFENLPMYEFNIGWYNGESGGPVIRPAPLAVVALMQRMRIIQAPHGAVSGPHLGRPVSVVAARLVAMGASVVA